MGSGGDSGGFGLYVDGAMFSGTTNYCETFLNKPLTDAVDFQVVELELWSLEMG